MSAAQLLHALGAFLGVFLQPTLAQIAIAVSVFSLIIYLWLGVTVLLMGNRASMVTWAGGMGLLCGALFFLCHGALVGAGVPVGPSTADFWWRLSWIPGFLAPLFWAAIGLHYANLAGAWRRLRWPALLAVAALGALAALLALLSWPAIARYGDFIRLLDASLRLQGAPARATISPAIPFLGVAFVIYVGACACLPWASLVVKRWLPPSQRAGGASADAALLWDSNDAWSRARPALLMASLLIILTGAVVAVIGLLLAVAEHRALLGDFSRDISGLPVSVPTTAPGHAPLLLVIADVFVQGPLAGVGLMVGWAVVRQGVLVERRLPQQGFLSHWRVMGSLAAVFAAVVAWMAALQPEALPSLLLLVALVASAYALLTWQAYMAHDRLLAQLRPFVASLAVGHTGWLATDLREVERSVEALFTSLCRDVLGAAYGALTVSAGRLSRAFTYTTPEAESLRAATLARAAADNAALPSSRIQRLRQLIRQWRDRTTPIARSWTIPVSDERGVVARMTFGPRLDGAGYTSADAEIARACGQRILDAVGEFAAAQAVASLARRRGLEAELSAALPRRTLHDDVLPRLHLAILRIESLRAQLARPNPLAPCPQGWEGGMERAVARAAGNGESGVALAPSMVDAVTPRATPQGMADDLGAVALELSHAHHDLAALMRAAPMASPRRMQHGFTGALRGSLDGEFRGVFDTLEVAAPADAVVAADALPDIVADLLLSATLEAARNAGRHGRGDDLHRALNLRVSLSADDQWVTVDVMDDGVGLQPGPQPASADGARGGQPGPGGEDAAPDASAPTGTFSVPGATKPTNSAATTAATTAGTRSGLLTHGALMALIGGGLTVHSAPGAGATVTIRAPRAISAADGV